MGMRIMHDYLGGFRHWFTTPWTLPGGMVVEPIGMVEFLIILVFLWWGGGLGAAAHAPGTEPATGSCHGLRHLAAYLCEMIVWVERAGLMRPGGTRAKYNWALADTLEQAGIEIPRPRQEVVVAPSLAAALAAAENLSSSSST